MDSAELFAVGIVGPGCYDICGFQAALYSARATSQSEPKPAVLRIDDSMWRHGIETRLLRRIDRFSQLAIYAAEQCLAKCSALTEGGNPDLSSIGLAIGNNFGGWSYVEPMMRPLYEKGMTAINPYVATAWFPAAAQGEISIRLGIRGISKTFAADRLSSAYALEYACVLLQNAKLDIVLAGGAESPLSPAVLESLRGLGVISDDVPAGEAACFLGLRKKTSDRYPQIAGIGKGDNPGAALSKAMEEGNLQGDAPDLIFLDPPRGTDPERTEHLARQLQAASALYGREVHVAQPLPFGETIGPAFALQAAAAWMALETQCIPEYSMEKKYEGILHNHGFARSGKTPALLRRIAILASDAYSQWMCAVITGPLKSAA